MASVSSANSKIKIFISYSHKDEVLKEELCDHLANLQQQGKIETWNDRAIEAGAVWEETLKKKFYASKVILLLITPRFMASDYCYGKEMQWSIERHENGDVRIIPIIMKPCDWHGAPFSRFQVLPKDGKPVTTWANQDLALLDAAKGIRRAVESLVKKHIVLA